MGIPAHMPVAKAVQLITAGSSNEYRALLRAYNVAHEEQHLFG